MAVPAVSTRPTTLVSARSPAASARIASAATAHQPLGAPLGSGAGQPGASELPDDDDGRHRLDTAVQAEPEQGDRTGDHRRDDRDPALDAHPGQGEPRQDPGEASEP
jgi:hypothetical protein